MNDSNYGIDDNVNVHNKSKTKDMQSFPIRDYQF